MTNIESRAWIWTHESLFYHHSRLDDILDIICIWYYIYAVVKVQEEMWCLLLTCLEPVHVKWPVWPLSMCMESVHRNECQNMLKWQVLCPTCGGLPRAKPCLCQSQEKCVMLYAEMCRTPQLYLLCIGLYLQLGAVITQSNMTWCCIQHYSDWSRTSVRICTHKRHPISWSNC